MPARPPARSALPAGFSWAGPPLAVRFGSVPAILRPLTPGDARRLLAFFQSHTEETICYRYGHAGVHMTPERAARLVGVDQTRDAALGVFETAPPGPRLIAVGRYCLAPDGRWAEVAFVVHETRRERGIATLLLAALVAIARERKLERLVAEVQHDNAPMLHVLHAAGATFTSSLESPTVQATLKLSIAPAAPPAPSRRFLPSHSPP